jgi:hypothetical protein
MKPTKTKIASALRDGIFDPKYGVMSVVADVGYPLYYITRARELLLLAEGCDDSMARDEYLTTALRLIALAKVTGKENGCNS